MNPAHTILIDDDHPRQHPAQGRQADIYDALVAPASTNKAALFHAEAVEIICAEHESQFFPPFLSRV